jgi:hypothetical protein
MTDLLASAAEVAARPGLGNSRALTGAPNTGL